jgi:thiamine biosynthesis lipoprotein ApbE
MKTKTYEVEFTSTTSRQYCVNAKNKAEAEEKAIEELQTDTEVSSCWVENSKVSQILDTATENTWMNANGKLED